MRVLRSIGTVSVPDSAIAVVAAEVLHEYCDQHLTNHCLRCYFWAADWGARNDIVFDPELLFVAAALHDLALSPQFDSYRLDFESAGGHLARLFTAGAGWDRSRRDRLAEIIVLHMRDGVAADVNPEAHLLQIAVSTDVSGRCLDDFADDFSAAVRHAYPRTGFATAFLNHFGEQAERKPSCAAAQLMNSAWPARVRSHPHDLS